jgi:hypothetical protein
MNMFDVIPYSLATFFLVAALLRDSRVRRP